MAQSAPAPGAEVFPAGDIAPAPQPPSEPANMASDMFRLLGMILPKIPLIARAALLHVLRLSEPAQYLDLRSALIITVLRSFLEPSPSKPRSVSSVQKLSVKDPGVKGRIWVSTYASPQPTEEDARDVLLQAINDLREPGVPEPKFGIPDLIPVEAEWTGYRAKASAKELPPVMSEKEKYGEMMKEVTSPATVLYLHGGAYYMCDPSTHRPTTKKLAKLTGGRCYSVRYRLAPQGPFPAALLDALVSYLTLLYPPPDAYHEPVRPEHIVFAGDSAGGNLVLALAQLILHLRNNNIRPTWYGSPRDIPLPVGIATNSPWLDITQSAPTWQGSTPHTFDYLPKPAIVAKGKIQDDEIWPASPPRRYLYVDDDLAAHPLSSVLMSKTWKGMPPMYMCTGWEILAHEDKYLARKLESEGVKLVFEEYEAMPHCFGMVLPSTPNARRCFTGWAGFIRAVVEDPSAVVSKATMIKARGLEEVPLEFGELSTVSEDEIWGRVRKMAAARAGKPTPAKL